MISLSKILLLALVIGVVWFGWRWVNRIQAIGRARSAPRRQDGRRDAAAGPAARDARPHPAAMEAEDMEKCPECGAYVAPRSAVSCGRPSCPYGR
ncbi:hypothetical protein VY88_05135 [Azospirillum thiophilum]|uniref:Uncharacterized protein n=1 Tax=Azospirillum thiophilum TaxID=528244 RepID=A0AAC8VWE9_9PROT|nr:hypothetical protein [Azospirillum thiophilum]ALG70798.1 hypothetical protein AL072_07575 [Azospirillum thiophilum]KJR65537.1 hypothetical protein VY88_05135 [Azospirillum thiophilum]